LTPSDLLIKLLFLSFGKVQNTSSLSLLLRLFLKNYLINSESFFENPNAKIITYLGKKVKTFPLIFTSSPSLIPSLIKALSKPIFLIIF